MESQIIEDLQNQKVFLRKWKSENPEEVNSILDKLDQQNITIFQLKETKISQVIATIANKEPASEAEKQIISKSQKLLEKWKSNFKNQHQNDQTQSPQKVLTPEVSRPMLTTDEQKDLERFKKLDELKNEKDAKARIQKQKDKKRLDDVEPQPEKHVKISPEELPEDKSKQNQDSPLSKEIIPDEVKLKYHGHLPHYDNDVRAKGAEVLYEALQTDFDKDKLSINDKEYIIGIVVGVENALFNKFGMVDQKYQNDIRKLNANLKNKNNPDFRKKVINQVLSFKEIAKVDPSQMTSEKYKKEKEQIEANMQESRLSDWHTEFLKKNAKIGGCMCINSRCQSTKTLTRLFQTRGADEPMTQFNECLDCGKKWKV